MLCPVPEEGRRARGDKFLSYKPLTIHAYSTFGILSSSNGCISPYCCIGDNFQLYFGGTKTMTNDHPEAGLESAVILWFLGLGEGSHIYVKHSAKQIGWL